MALWFYFKRIKKSLPHCGAYLQHELIFLTNKINHSTLLGPVGNVDPSRLLGAFSVLQTSDSFTNCYKFSNRKI